MTETEDQELETAVEVIDEGPCKKRLKTHIPAEVVEDKVRSSYQQLGSTVQLPGFRPGRVPRSVLERKFSKQVEEDVREEMLQETFEQEIKKHELRLVGRPEFERIEFKVGQPFEFEAVFEVAPHFDLPEYKGLEIEARDVTVDEDAVSSEVESLREQYADFQVVEPGSVQTDDFAVADVKLGLEEDDADERISREDVYLKIGLDAVDNISVEGLSDRLREAQPGDTCRFEPHVPDDFVREDLAGKTVPLEIKVKEFRRRRLPELGDEFARRLQVESLDELRGLVRRNLEQRRKTEEENRLEAELVDRVCGEVDMELPQSIVEARQKELEYGLRFRLSREGKSEEEIDQEIEADTSLAEEARRELKRLFVLDEISEKETILVVEEEVVQRLSEIAAAYGREVGEIVEEYRERGMLGELRAGILREKVRRFLRQKAKLVSEPDQNAARAAGGESSPPAESDGE